MNIHMKPLMLIVGKNGSGKSNFMCDIMQRTLLSTYLHVFWMINDKRVVSLVNENESLGVLDDMKRVGFSVPDDIATDRHALSFCASHSFTRTFSLLTEVNYRLTTGKPEYLFVDDLAQGLDYERASNLAKLLLEKVDVRLRLVMSTQSREVMNVIPIEYWVLLRRDNGNQEVFTYETHKKLFDDFDFTGLGNYGFFSSDYLDVKLQEFSQLSP